MSWENKEFEKLKSVIQRSGYDYSDGFIAWLKNNGDVWSGFAIKAVLANTGRHKTRFGSKAILELLRWESFVSDADVTFKINNNYASDMARLVMDCKPEMKGYFRIRGSEHRSDAAN